MRRITSAGPSITEAEILLVTEAIREGWQDRPDVGLLATVMRQVGQVEVDTPQSRNSQELWGQQVGPENHQN